MASEHTPVSCLPEATSLQSYEVWSSSGQSKVYPLKSLRFGQITTTDVRLKLEQKAQTGRLELSFYFIDPEIMGLPFNLYAVLVVSSRGEHIWRDLTAACTDPGVGFFPGQKFDLDPIPLSLEEGESYQVMVWGQM